MSDESKEFSPEQPKDKIEELNAQPITENDAESVKGGRATYDIFAKLGDIKGES